MSVACALAMSHFIFLLLLALRDDLARSYNLPIEDELLVILPEAS